MNGHTNTPLPVSAYSEEEWAATIRYAEEHASEQDGFQHTDIVHQDASFYGVPGIGKTPPRPSQPTAQDVFDYITAHNRALAEFYRHNPPRWL